MNDERLFRTMIHALRHDPWKYGLELDDDGFTFFEDLVTGLRFDRYDWALLEIGDVERVLHDRGEARFERHDGRIRARYGHSIELGKLPPVETPPELLFHGTLESVLLLILTDGLKPMSRRFVHLTSDRDYADRVARAKNGNKVLAVLAAKAHAAGATFYRANEHVWLTQHVAASFLESPAAGEGTHLSTAPAS